MPHPLESLVVDGVQQIEHGEVQRPQLGPLPGVVVDGEHDVGAAAQDVEVRFARGRLRPADEETTSGSNRIKNRA